MPKDFLLTVITKPGFFPGEADLLAALLDAGVERLHIRKPGASHMEVGALLEQLLCGESAARIVLHGFRKLALHYGIRQVHGPWEDGGVEGLALSSSLHSWEAVKGIPAGKLEYVFISPLFDSVSKAGYRGRPELLQCPMGLRPCRYIGLGGVNEGNIGELLSHGWDGAAVLGWIWERPEEAVSRYHTLKKIITHGA